MSRPSSHTENAGVLTHKPVQTRLILVRHAETEANLNQVWHGDLDAPLTPRGQAQVLATAHRLAELHAVQPIDLFYVSPLPRAQSTAAAIAEAIGLPVLIEPGLREFGLGDWEGRSFRELRELENLWGRWEADPTFAPPNGESPRSFNQRATQTLNDLAARHPGQTVLAVTHGAFISSVLASWLGAHAGEWRAFDPHNCALSILVQEGKSWRGEVVNDISHLPLAARADYESDY
jgi:broad specificity phosphatase PhoE